MSPAPVLIVGARSDIGRAMAHRFAALGHPLQLAARDAGTLADDRADLTLRYGVTVTLHAFDALATEGHDSFVSALPALPAIAVVVVGLMGDQAESERDTAAAIRVLRSTFEGPAIVLGVLANHFAARGSGLLVAISSVAGERGRARNYVYGSAKAGLTAFLSGLRNRLAGQGVRVMTVLPGFVATRMTEGMDLPPLLTAQPAEVAEAITRAIHRRQDVVYVKPVWRLLMLIVRTIPEPIFRRMKL